MDYIVKNDLIERVSEESLIAWTDDNNAGVVNDALITAIITKVEGIVNGYLSGIMDEIPVESPTQLIKTWTEDISIYMLKKRHLEVEDDDPVYLDYKNALKSLEKVSNGQLSIPGTSETAQHFFMQSADREMTL